MKKCLMGIYATVILLSSCNKQAIKNDLKEQPADASAAPAVGRYIPTGNTWVYKTTFQQERRHGASSFVLNNKLYVFGGEDEANVKKRDLWEYDPSSNTWTQKASLPHIGRARTHAVAFVIGGKGYIATGFNNNQFPMELKDCWQYDPVTNGWTKKADFAGVARFAAAAFSINGRGYVGMGNSINPQDPFYLNDFWQYDPITDSWQQKTSIQTTESTQGRSYPFSFTIGDKGYVGAGNGPISGGAYKDLWQYDAVADTWTQKADFGGGPRSYATAVSTGTVAYAGTGEFREAGSPDVYYSKDFWKYNPTTDSWTKRADFGGYKRKNAISFYSNGSVYMGLGYHPNYTSTSDIYKYIP